MSTKTTLKHALPDGAVETRTTARTYRYALVGFGKSWNDAVPRWHVVQWTDMGAAVYRRESHWRKAGYSQLQVEEINHGMRS